MGGRGASSVSRFSGGAVKASDILATRSLVSERERDAQSVDEVLTVFRDVGQQYGVQIEDIELATMKAGSNAMAYYDGQNVAFNEKYFNPAKMSAAYADCVADGFHPSNGNKTALQAVAAHEIGHQLTDVAAYKMGAYDLHAGATRIVTEARKQTKHRGNVQMASKISKYATASDAETIAEAFSDVYCNGNKARSESRAIVNVMNGYLK